MLTQETSELIGLDLWQPDRTTFWISTVTALLCYFTYFCEPDQKLMLFTLTMNWRSSEHGQSCDRIFYKVVQLHKACKVNYTSPLLQISCRISLPKTVIIDWHIPQLWAETKWAAFLRVSVVLYSILLNCRMWKVVVTVSCLYIAYDQLSPCLHSVIYC